MEPNNKPDKDKRVKTVPDTEETAKISVSEVAMEVSPKKSSGKNGAQTAGTRVTPKKNSPSKGGDSGSTPTKMTPTGSRRRLDCTEEGRLCILCYRLSVFPISGKVFIIHILYSSAFLFSVKRALVLTRNETTQF